MTTSTAAVRPPRGFKIDTEAARMFTDPEATGPTTQTLGGSVTAGAAWTAAEGVTYWLNAAELDHLTRGDLQAVHDTLGGLLEATGTRPAPPRAGVDLLQYVNGRMEALPTVLNNWQAGYEQAMMDVREQLSPTASA